MRRVFVGCALVLAAGCGPLETGADEAEPTLDFTSIEQGLVSCNYRQDTGYSSGNAFPITVVSADGKAAEVGTANAYSVMQDAARANGVSLVVVSGFRTMAEQQYLYACYVNCNCNSCNLAARPGTSNHQSGHALDLNTSSAGVLTWLNNNGARFGFRRTVPSETWHWEWWGGGPGGGPCGNTDDNCTGQEAQNCGNFGCGCVDHQCNGGFCPGTGCSAQHTQNCGAFGCGCADGTCAGAFCPGSGCTAKEVLDCGGFGCGCVDHVCNGGVGCGGTGCTAREALDCGGFGCNCVDHECNGGYCPGTGCTAKETSDCTAQGCGCVDHACSGGSCQGAGCTARQVLDCQSADAGCALGRCIAGPAGPPPTVDAGTPPPPPQPDASVHFQDPEPDPFAVTPPAPLPAAPEDLVAPGPVVGSCSAAPGSIFLLPLVGWALARRRRRARQR